MKRRSFFKSVVSAIGAFAFFKKKDQLREVTFTPRDDQPWIVMADRCKMAHTMRELEKIRHLFQ